METIIVKNKKGTSDRKVPSPANSWLEYWIKASGYPSNFPVCRHPECSWPAGHGAHVLKVDETSKEYIIPLCSYHNNPNFEESFPLNEEDLVDPDQEHPGF